MAYVDHISVDGVQYDIRDAEAVSFEQEQTLNDVQQEQARANIGAGSEADVADLKSQIEELAENGYYEESHEEYNYLELEAYGIKTDGTTDSNDKKAHIWLTSAQEALTLYFDASVYKYNLCYKNNGSVVQYTSWITTSPIEIDGTITHDQIGITFTTLNSSPISGDDLDNILFSQSGGRTIGNLATKAYVNSAVASINPRGRKVIYPDDFSSRIKPDIYYNGRYYADIDYDNYKIAGSGNVWVSTDGNDSTGDGTEGNPYATITKALTTAAKTIHVKEGTYAQGTHYGTSVDFGGRNLIGHGTVTLQNDSEGHYVKANTSAYIENIIFKHGNATSNSAFVTNGTSSGNVVCFVGCTFCDGGSNGLAIKGTDAILIGCVAYGNKLDGFNYHDNTSNDVTYIPNALEIDCIAYNNGTSESGSDSCNGSTAHDGTKIIRLSGEYYSCYGGVIAEIARTGEEPTISVNYGVLAHDSTGTGTYKASFWASINTQMYLYDCQSYGGDYDISAINDAKIVSWRLTTGRDNPSVNAASTATVIQH